MTTPITTNKPSAFVDTLKAKLAENGCPSWDEISNGKEYIYCDLGNGIAVRLSEAEYLWRASMGLIRINKIDGSKADDAAKNAM